MKKLKRIISVLTSIAILMSLCCTFSVTAAEYAPITPSADAFVQGDDQNANRGTNPQSDLYSKPTAGKSNRYFQYYSFDLPEIASGEKVTNAKFAATYSFTGSASGSEYYLRFYLVTDSWYENTITYSNQPLALVSSSDQSTTDFPVAEYDMQFDVMPYTNTSEFQRVEIDIAPLVNKYLDSENTANDFSFAVIPYMSGNTIEGYTKVRNKEYEDESQRPTLTLESQADFKVESTTPSRGASGVDKDSEIVIEFTADVDSTTVSPSDISIKDIDGNALSVTDDDISISGSTLTINVPLQGFGFYTVTVKGISGTNEVALNTPYTFSFSTSGGKITSNLPIKAEYRVSVGTPGGVTDATDGWEPGKIWAHCQGGYNYMIYVLDLSSLGSASSIESSEFEWSMCYDVAGHNSNVYVVPNGTHSSVEAITTEYINQVHSAVQGGNIADTVKFAGTSMNPEAGVADITSAVKAALADPANTNKELTLAFTEEWTAHYCLTNSANPPRFTVVQSVNSESETVSASVKEEYAVTVGTAGAATDETDPNPGDGKLAVHCQNGYRYMIYVLDLSQLGNANSIVSSEFEWSMSYDIPNQDRNVYVVPNGTHSSVSDITTDYIDQIHAAVQGGRIADEVRFAGVNMEPEAGVADITSAVKMALADPANTRKELTLAFTEDWTANYYLTNSSTPPRFTVKRSVPSFNLVTSDPVIGTKMDTLMDSVTMSLATTLPDSTGVLDDYIKLIKITSKGTEEVDASVESANGIITITPDAPFDENTNYKVVLKAGLEDEDGNVLSADKTILVFISWSAFDISEIIFTKETTPIYDSAVVIHSYDAGDSVTAVVKVSNNTPADREAVMLIGLYGENNEMVHLDYVGGEDWAVAGETTQFSKEINVPSTAESTYIKAFLWESTESIKPISVNASINQIAGE